jgi:uncharacterized membrane protein YbhN (UPF0104 family)
MSLETRATRRRALVTLGLAVLLVIGVALLVGRAAGYDEILDALRAAEPRWLPACLAGEIVSYCGYVVVFRAVAEADRGPTLGLRLSTEIVFLSLGATRLLAAGGAGGLAFDYWALHRTGMSRHGAFLRVLALNTILYGVFGLLAWSAALVLLGRDGGPIALIAPWLFVVPACVAAGIWVSGPGRAPGLTRRTGGRVRALFADAVGGVVLVRGLLFDRAGRLGVLGAAAYWSGDMFCLWAALQAFHVQTSVAPVVLAYATGYVATLVPLPTGGLGSVEAAMTFALVAVGVGLSPALLGVVTYRLFSYWLPTIPALAVLPRLPAISTELEGFARR